MASSSSNSILDQVNEWLIEIVGHPEPYQSDSRLGFIYRVPEDIRRKNENAYTPKLISIGPLHYGKEKLADMETRKKMCLKDFCRRFPLDEVAMEGKKIVSLVLQKEQEIRDYYGEDFEFLESNWFVKMIVCDAIFIIEHFLSTCFDDIRHTLLHKPKVQSAISLDLILLENQLPFFILREIFDLVFVEDVTFMQISIRFFKFAFNLDFPDQPEPKHFTELIRNALVRSCPKVKPKGPIRDLPCAMKLHESGVQFRISQGTGIGNIRLVERKRLLPCLKVKELQIPRFTIYDSTECLLRNVMALEQFHYPSDTLVCNYVRFMDYLINTEKDVELLVAGGIIADVVLENAQIAKIFNDLGAHVISDGNSCYYKICEELKEHYENPSNKKKASLENVYFRDLWTGTATIAAAFLLVLTAVQTICSIKQVI